jgi:hypothetical protein
MAGQLITVASKLNLLSAIQVTIMAAVDETGGIIMTPTQGYHFIFQELV